MNTKLKYSITLVIGLVLGFLLASQLPLLSVISHFSDSTVTQFQKFDLLIRILAAVGTFMAVAVALFKEDIRRLWEHASVELKSRDSDWLREILEGSKGEDESDEDSDLPAQNAPSRRAERYEVSLAVKNTGSIPAKSCEIRLDQLVFKPTNEAREIEVDCGERPITWSGGADSRITILPDRHVAVEIAKISPPTRSKNGNGQSVLTIGNIPMKDRAGTWVATFSVFGENVRLTKITLTFWWNGQWEHRKTEMSQRFTVKKV